MFKKPKLFPDEPRQDKHNISLFFFEVVGKITYNLWPRCRLVFSAGCRYTTSKFCQPFPGWPLPCPIRSRGENMIDRLAAPAAQDVEPIHTHPLVLGGCLVDRYSAKASPAFFFCFPHSFQHFAACPGGGRNPHLPFSGDAGPERVRSAAPTRSLHCTSRSTR